MENTNEFGEKLSPVRWIVGVAFVIQAVANHSHEIAQKAGSLAGDFVKGMKEEKRQSNDR